MKRFLILASALIALPAVAASCDGLGTACTEIGCDDGITLTVTSASGLTAGVYSISIAISGQGESASCTVTVNSAAQVTDTTCDLVDNTASSFTVVLHTAPETLTLTLDRDGTELGKQDFMPAYKAFQPNGPDCEPTCFQADASMQIP